MNTTHHLVWFGHNLVTTLYERSHTSKFCSFRVLSQEFGGKSKKMAVTWGLRASLFGCMVEAIQVTQIIVAIQAIALAVVMMMMIVVMTMMVMMTMMMMVTVMIMVMMMRQR